MKSETEIKALLAMIDSAHEKAMKANNETRTKLLENLHCILHYVLGHNCNAAKSFKSEIKKFLSEKEGAIPSFYKDMTQREAIEFNLFKRRN